MTERVCSCVGVPDGESVNWLVSEGVNVIDPTVEVLVGKASGVGLFAGEGVGVIVISGVTDGILADVSVIIGERVNDGVRLEVDVRVSPTVDVSEDSSAGVVLGSNGKVC